MSNDKSHNQNSRISRGLFRLVLKTLQESYKRALPSPAYLDLPIKYPKDRVNIRISSSCSTAQYKVDIRNTVLLDPSVYVVFWGPTNVVPFWVWHGFLGLKIYSGAQPGTISEGQGRDSIHHR